MVITSSNESPERGSNPIYPMIMFKVAIRYARTERPRRIKGSSSVINPYMISQPCRRTMRYQSTGNAPASSATNNAKPMPTGAMKVAFDFSAANIKTVKISSAVRNISIKRP